jgi:hypothetical protein
MQGDTHIRVRYANDVVRDIEFFSGSLEDDAVELHDAKWSDIEAQLNERGFAFEDASWLGHGKECEALGITLRPRPTSAETMMTSESMGHPLLRDQIME